MLLPLVQSRTFFALHHSQFRTFWFGTFFSFLGMQMQMIARGFLAYELTGSNSALGLMFFATGLPPASARRW